VTLAASKLEQRATEIDFLRFIAAVSVMFYHFTYRRTQGGDSVFPGVDAVTRYGYLGVNLFFMISGFVIMWSALGRSPSSFVRSRFLRLYPTFWLCMAITVGVVYALTGGLFTIEALAKNATMLAGYLNADYVDGVYWTLQLELKFYALVFLMLVLGASEHAERCVFAWLAAAVCAEHLPFLSPLRMLVIYPYGFFFIAGALFFFSRRDGWAIGRSMALLICLAYSCRAAVIERTGFLFDARAPDTAVVVIAIVLLYVCFAFLATRSWSKYFGRWAVTLGALTYPIYLLHNRGGKLLMDRLEHVLPLGLALIIVLVLVFSVAWLLVLFVEKRVVDVCDRVMRSSRAALFQEGG
jgi:peptidoglycan/LPS O-acetylase OafA/YrhL